VANSEYVLAVLEILPCRNCAGESGRFSSILKQIFVVNIKPRRDVKINVQDHHFHTHHYTTHHFKHVSLALRYS